MEKNSLESPIRPLSSAPRVLLLLLLRAKKPTVAVAAPPDEDNRVGFCVGQLTGGEIGAAGESSSLADVSTAEVAGRCAGGDESSVIDRSAWF